MKRQNKNDEIKKLKSQIKNLLEEISNNKDLNVVSDEEVNAKAHIQAEKLTNKLKESMSIEK